MELMATVPNIEFDKGISSELENDSFFNTNKRNLMVINDQMEDAGGDKRTVNLFTRGSHYRNLSVIYIVQNLFHQGKNSRSISLNSHYLVLLKNPRDKLAKQMYPENTDLFIKRYEEAVRRPFGYLLVDLKRRGTKQYLARTTEVSQATELSDSSSSSRDAEIARFYGWSPLSQRPRTI